MPEANNNNGGRPTDTQARDALSRVVASDAFASSPRLQQFLSYVVEESLGGRGGAIRGKTIATDVYDRDIDDIDSGENLVRVEARRLRRLLSDYYAGPGRSDPWQIHIDLGGYVPAFTSAETNDQASPDAFSGRSTWLSGKHLALGSGVILVILLATVMFVLRPSEKPNTSLDGDAAIRAALRDRSVPALQAVNLADQARGMFFPVFDLKRQQLALEIFNYVIELDSGLHQGYAGAAQVLATLALFTPDNSMSAAHLADAQRMAQQSLEISPESAWAHGANGLVLAVSGEFENALSQTRLAVTLAPEDGHILDLAGMTAILINDPDFAAQVSDPARARSGIGRFGANNIWGVSQYMLGNHDAVIDAFAGAPNTGLPVSAPSLVFLAIAYDHTGEDDQAERLVRELTETWPDLPMPFLVERVFRNAPEYRNDILERLAKHGYRKE